MIRFRAGWTAGALVLTTLLVAATAQAAGVAHAPGTALAGIEVSVTGGTEAPAEVASALRIVLGLTILSIAPAMLIAMTSFTRIVIVLSLLRHAFGTQETPPNSVMVTLALFLTLFTMAPVLQKVNDQAFQPYIEKKLAFDKAVEVGLEPLREFMIRQTREQDLALMVEISRQAPPRRLADVGTLQLVPAFMLSELKSAFQIGFVIFLPFLLIDLLVSSILMSLGMFMVPPVTIALPIKLLMFVLTDGWNVVVRSLVYSFH